ncbi:DUF488 domain-containing protein [Methylocystis sp. IM3]|jgi:uncharacterized protein YeaO (DUF488 family)|uniref:DUF488 domain-containing protein n=1 Tax=unclassified Methylocystis TaxID=2625913 RepID=UPI0030F56FBD
MHALLLKRVYEPPEKDDGARVLVDRLWPRGLTKEKAALDHWAKEVAPSNELRRWFGHRPDRWEEFAARYREELEAPPAQAEIAAIRRLLRQGRVTLLYAAHDEAQNNAVVLREALRKPH